MTSKKLFFLAISSLFILAADAQVTSSGGYDWRDSSVVPPSRMEQHFEFVNNQYAFPAKPRSQWEIGLKVGTPSVEGDVDAVYPGIGFGIHARKALGYLFSIRGEYTNGTARGLGGNFIPGNTVAVGNGAWEKYGTAKKGVWYNYKTNVNELNLHGIITLNNISFHRAEPKVLVYGLFGAGLMFYNTKLDVDNNGTLYNFDASQSKSTIKGLLDGTYETKAATSGNKLKPTTSFGFGASFKVSNKVNVSLEDRMTYVKDDYLDGVKYYYSGGNQIVSNRNDTFMFFSFGLNINLF